MKLPVQSMPVERNLVTTGKADVNGVEASDFLDDFTRGFNAVMGPATALLGPLLGALV
ncbi:MAG: hypothetical protein Kow00121_19960 [Elainellaceae cyanobacterium]